MLRLLDVAPEVKLAACEGNDAVETCLYFRRKIAPRHQALCLRANRFLRLHEVPFFSLLESSSAIRVWVRGMDYRSQADVS